jgi:hypothetical protein
VRPFRRAAKRGAGMSETPLASVFSQGTTSARSRSAGLGATSRWRRRNLHGLFNGRKEAAAALQKIAMRDIAGTLLHQPQPAAVVNDPGA